MIKIFNPVSLDVARSNDFATVLAKQGDQNSRFITATVNLNGNKVIVPADSRVRLNVIRPDGAGASFSGYVLDDGRVTLPIDRWVTSVAGDSRCSVEITHEMQVLTTMRFTVRTEESDDVNDLDDPDIFPTDPEYDAVLALLDDYTSGRLGAAKVFIRYSQYSDGTDLSETWSAGQRYIGFAAGSEAPTNKEGYSWSRFVGDSGGGSVELVQEEGDSEYSAMSQKAVTDALKARELCSVELARPAVDAERYLVLLDKAKGAYVGAAYPVLDRYDVGADKPLPSLLKWCGASSATVYTFGAERKGILEISRVGGRISVYWDAAGGTPTTELYYDNGHDLAILYHDFGGTVKTYAAILDGEGRVIRFVEISDFDAVAMLDEASLPADCRVQKNHLYRMTFVNGSTKTFEVTEEKEGFDYKKYGLPVVYLNGDTAGISKDNKVNLNYVYGDRSGTCTLKWQGGSSIKYPKKNYTVTFDTPFEAAEGWGAQTKYCLKANYIDFTHARNIVSAKLWGQMLKTRHSDNLKNLLPEEYKDGAGATKNGITFAVNDDGSIKVSGTASAGASFDLSQIDFGSTSVWNITSSKVSGDYVISLRGDNIPTGVNAVVLSYNGNNHILTLNIASGTVIDTTLYPMVERGATATVWESQRGDAVTLKLKSLVNGGAIDGFPICLVINNEYQGIYTFNIPKDGWMFGMGEGAQEGIICADAHTDGTRFKAEAVIGSDFSHEYSPDKNNIGWMTESLNRLINACIASDGTDLDSTVGQYLDWNSAIDYLILVALLNGGDMTDKNYILATYDGVKWFFSAYDMDTTYGINWDGASHLSTTKGASLTYYTQLHRVMALIKSYKKDKLKARYAELRKGILSEDNVMLAFSNFIGSIPKALFDREVEIWPTLPSTSTCDLNQIVNYFNRRAALTDAEIESL